MQMARARDNRGASYRGMLFHGGDADLGDIAFVRA
jgi:hypothetical protein